MRRKPTAKGAKHDFSSFKERPKTLDAYGKVLGEDLGDCLDRMEEALRHKLLMFTLVLGSAARARQTVLGGAPSPRDRAVYGMLLKQKPTAKNNGAGRRKSVETSMADNALLGVQAEWQTARRTAGTDRGFASWWFRRETGRTATDKDIRKITKRLRDARRRVGQQLP
jgi:hypothetical protein